MASVRVLFGFFLIGHGLAHASWFVPAVFLKREYVADQSARTRVPPARLGWPPGVMAVVVTWIFVAGGIGVLGHHGWWAVVTLVAVVVSVLLATWWWDPVHGASLFALLCNAIILGVVLLALAAQVLGGPGVGD